MTEANFVTQASCDEKHGTSKAWMKLNVALLSVLIGVMGLFVFVTYQAAAQATSAQVQGEENERLLTADVKATVVWRANVDAKFTRIENKLDSIEAYLRDKKLKP